MFAETVTMRQIICEKKVRLLWLHSVLRTPFAKTTAPKSKQNNETIQQVCYCDVVA